MHTYAEFPLDHFDKNMHLVIWTKQKRGRNDNIYIGCEPIVLHQGLCSKNCFNFAVFSPIRWWKGISQRGKIHFLESNMKRQLTSENGKVEGRKMIFSVLFMAKWFSGFILVVFLRQRKKTTEGQPIAGIHFNPIRDALLVQVVSNSRASSLCSIKLWVLVHPQGNQVA